VSGLFDRADLLDGLNPRQREAAGVVDGPVLVLAGAGSGKTRVLTHRIAWLIHRGVKPWQILAMTFTNKAASEMRERVQALLAAQGRADAARDVWLSTFHSTCVRFLRRDIEALGYPRAFTIYDADDQKRLLKTILGELGASEKLRPNEVRSRIDQAKNRLESIDAYAARAELPAGDRTIDAWRAYERSLKAANAVDFNDLIGHVVRLWREHPAVLRRYRQRFRYLLVDEYQDTNRAQFELVRLLAGDQEGMPPHRNVMVVGDDDQSIYGFRGADVRNILDFSQTFPGAQVVRLERNYRSTANILAAANAVVKNNRGRMPKELWTESEAGAKVLLHTADDDYGEARFVAERVGRAVRSGARRYGDFAVIYRTNSASRVFEQQLTRARIPHVLVGARKFYERREIRDVVAYLKLLLNPADDMAFTRVVNVPRRGIGAKTLAGFRAQADAQGVSLLEAARRWADGGRGKARAAVQALLRLLDELRAAVPDHEPGELVHMLVRETGYDEWLRKDDEREAADRLANVRELAAALAEDDPDDAGALDERGDPWDPEAGGGDADDDPFSRLQRFLDKASLSGQADELPDEEAGRVTLLTAHLAKGLEFPVVFVAGMFEGGFPHFRAREREEDLEEERRLVYVAFTRAQAELVLTRPRMRSEYGAAPKPQSRSRFLGEIPTEILEVHGEGARRRPRGLDREARAQRLGLAGGSRPARARRRLRNMTPAPPAAPVPPPSGNYRTEQIESPGQLSRGARVLHPKFGPGTVRRVTGPPHNLKLVVAFDAVGPKTLYARFAQLELLV
jgi:DNA helicase-2/ATP-dependent DNA helicase PcrA